jgi:DNA-binding CsgD family transcriptional regulator
MSRLRAADWRKICQLLQECRELGDDPTIWRRHFFAGLTQLVDGDVMVGGEMSGCQKGPLSTVGITDFGFEAGYNRQGWLNALEQFERDPLENPLFRQLLKLLQSRDEASPSREQLMPQREWYRSDSYQLINRTLGADSVQHSWMRIPGSNDEFSGIIMTRELGRRQMSERQLEIVTVAHRHIAAFIGAGLARFTDPAPSKLPLRVRQVLRCLLEGDTDKQIALRLGLSAYTINQYTKTIYRHFSVCSRAQLMTRWIKNGWGAGGTWDRA